MTVLARRKHERSGSERLAAVLEERARQNALRVAEPPSVPAAPPWWRRIVLDLRADAILLVEKFTVLVGMLLVVAMILGYAVATLAMLGFILAWIGAYVGLKPFDLWAVAAFAFTIAMLIRELTRPSGTPP